MTRVDEREDEIRDHADEQRAREHDARARRSWASKFGEFALWALLSLAIAVVLVLLSDRLLAPNF